MTITYVNDLRLSEMATGDNSGTWGTVTNTNLELIGEAFGFGTEAITTDADAHPSTIADGSTDPARAMYVKYTGALNSNCTVTIGPNTVNKFYFIENATTDSGASGPYSLIISQGSGASITVPNGQTKAVYLDGAGTGAAVVDAFAALNVVDLTVQDDLTVTDDVSIGGLATIGGTLGVTGVLTATSLDISGDIDVDGTTNLDVVDIDGAVDMASTLQVDGAITSNGLLTVDGSANSSQAIFTGTSGRGLEISTFSVGAADEGVKLDATASGSTGQIALATNGTNRVVLDGNGDVLFGNGNGHSPKIQGTTNSGRTAGSPGYSFNDDLNTGMFQPVSVTDAIAFSTGGVERLRIDASGNVGLANNAYIGTLSSAHAIVVQGGAGNPGGSIRYGGGSGDNNLLLRTNGADRAELAAGGALLVGEIQEQTAGTDISLTMVSEDAGIAISCRSATDGHTPYLQFQKTPATSGNYTATGVGDFLGVINFNGVNTSGGSDAGGMIQVKQTGTASGTVPAEMQFFTNEAQRMTILSSGTVLVSKTASDGAVQGHELRINDFAIHTVDNGAALYARRIGSGVQDLGDTQIWQNNDGTFGVLGTRSGNLSIGSGDVGIEFHPADNAIYPMNMSNYTLRDNAINLGSGSYRYSTAFITNGVTTGSDRNEKQDIAKLTATEMLVAARLSKTFHTYRWKDSFVEKGEDARIHTGTIAQELQAAFTAEGLDAGRYGMFMSDTWWGHDVEVPAVEADDTVDPAIEAKDAYTRNDHYKTEDEAPSGSTKKTRLGIRYPELLSFLAAYNEQRFAAIETRLTALEA